MFVEFPRGLLETTLNGLAWSPVLFNDKLIGKNVVLHLNTNEISWLSYWE